MYLADFLTLTRGGVFLYFLLEIMVFFRKFFVSLQLVLGIVEYYEKSEIYIYVECACDVVFFVCYVEED